MKNINKILYSGLLAIGLFFTANSGSAQTISDHFFGENAWMPDAIGDVNACPDPPCQLNGKLHQNWGNIKHAGTQMVRFGGIAPDRNMPTNAQYIKMIDSIRGNGMEPIMQVPFHEYRYTALQAADIVNYINHTMGKNVKYWIIGNEPDLGYSYTSAAQVANYIKPFASAMKAVDPSIKIIGPETAWYNTGIIDGLTTPNGPNDITGKDASGRYYIDVISFHTYPFNGTQTRSQVISKLTSSGGLQDNLTSLNARIQACNAAHGRTGASALKTAITEANTAYKNDASDNISGLGTNSFIGGQFLAEMLAIGMKKGVDFINIWSVIEGNSPVNSLGIIESSTGIKKPSYYHFKMLADNFKGQFADGTTNQANVKSFGSYNGQFINVMIMNQDLSNSFNYTVRLNTSAVSGSSPLKININASVNKEESGSIGSQSTILLTFNSAGLLIKRTEYSLTGHALTHQPPTETNMVTTGISTPAAAPASSGIFEIKTFPNPSSGKFTVALDKADSKESSFDVEIFNLLGQQVYKKSSDFAEGKHQVEMSEGFAQGAYVVRVKEKHGKNECVQRVVLNK